MPLQTRRFALLLLIILVSACQPEATPFPVDVPPPLESTATSLPGTPIPIRYALDMNMNGFVSNPLQAESIQLTEPTQPADLGIEYDIIVAYGEREGWILSDTPLRVALLVNPNAAPLDNPTFAQAVRRALNPQTIMVDFSGVMANEIETDAPQDIRTLFANEGVPDGLQLTLAHTSTPGVNAVVEAFRVAGIETSPTGLNGDEIAVRFADRRLNIALAAWTTQTQREIWVEQLGPENVIDLYAIPISYQALPELTIIGTTPGGLPIAER